MFPVLMTPLLYNDGIIFVNMAFPTMILQRICANYIMTALYKYKKIIERCFFNVKRNEAESNRSTKKSNGKI